MKNIWYADKRDIVKWGTLIHLAKKMKAKEILQIAYYREDSFGQLVIDGKHEKIPDEVTRHFRGIRGASKIKTNIKICVFDEVITHHAIYIKKILAFIKRNRNTRKIVFLDPDTGLEPPKNKRQTKLEHVSSQDVLIIWKAINPGDVFVLYQHAMMFKKNWIDPKREQLEEALGVVKGTVKIARGVGPNIGKDVAFLYIEKAGIRNRDSELAA